MEKSWRRRAVQVDSGTIQCSTSLPSEKLSRRCPRKKKISAATGERRFADCSWLFPPCYSLGSYGQEIEEETGFSKIENSESREISKGCQAGSRGGKRSQTRGGQPRRAGWSVTEWKVRAET